MKETILSALILMTTLSGNSQQLKQFTLEDLNFGGKNYRAMSPRTLRLWWQGNTLVNSDTLAQPATYPQVFAREHNIYVQSSVGSQPVRVTADGCRQIVYGEAVHRNEFGIETGIFPSPDKTAFAFYRMDQSMVTDYPQVNTFTRIASCEPDAYPMAGMKSHKVTVGVYDIAAGTTVWLDLGDVTDRYFTNITWSPDGKAIYLFELNRDQTDTSLDVYSAETGKKLRTLYTEHSDKYVEPLHPVSFLPWDSDKFLLWSDRDGFRHLYLMDTRGRMLKQVTKGPFVVRDLVGFCPKTRSVIIATNELNPLQSNLFSVKLSDCRRTLLDNGIGLHSGKLSADGTVIHVVADKDATSYDVTVANGVAKLALLPKGKYYVTVDKGAFKAYSTTIDLNENVVSPIKLEDEVQTPYNITAEMENGAGGFDVSLKWNQLLGFSDSFETYDDFATGQFGDWKSVDLDQSAVYPIGLGSQTNIVKFPGSGTADAPTAIAPMVFNPWNTTPAMLPTDEAIEALDGDKFIAFFSPQQKQANKWLISPEIDIYDGFVLKVAAKSYASLYPESLEFAVSETCSTDPFDFKVLTEAPNISADAWLDYQTDLSAYAGKKVRIGVHYKTFDGFFAQLDNFRVEPEEGSGVQKDYGNVLHFNIYLDGKKVGESATPSFTINNVSEGKHTVGIEAVYKNSVSKMATYELVATGIGSVKVDAANADVKIYNIAGQKLNANFQSLPQGVYVVKDANGVRKVRK